MLLNFQSEIQNRLDQKADKGNTVVLLNRKDYISKMKLILADTSKFKKIQIDDSKVLSHLIHMENKVTELLKELKKRNKAFLIKSTMNYTRQVLDQVFYMVFVKSAKVLLMGTHHFVLYCQL